MSWIRMAVAGLALSVSASVSGAQGTPSGDPPQGGQPGMRGQGGRGQSMMFEGITLTELQQQKVDSIRASYRAERQKLMPNGMGGGPPDDAAREKMTAMMARQNADIRAVLDDTQKKTFDKNLEEMKKRREQMRSTPPKS
jgi:Spy/CpxP family protein refolding chaperone